MTGQPQDSGISPESFKSVVSKRSKIISAAHSPLGFCVLALLIVEAFLWGSGVWFDLPIIYKVIAIAVGVSLFLIVFITVVWLVVKYPQNLVFGEESHVQVAAMQRYGTEGRLISEIDLQAMPQVPAPPSPTEQLPPPTEGNQ